MDTQKAAATTSAASSERLYEHFDEFFDAFDNLPRTSRRALSRAIVKSDIIHKFYLNILTDLQDVLVPTSLSFTFDPGDGTITLIHREQLTIATSPACSSRSDHEPPASQSDPHPTDNLNCSRNINDPELLCPPSDKYYINCPFHEKDDAKKAGAKWDGVARLWYIPKYLWNDIERFKRWETNTTKDYIPQTQEKPQARGRVLEKPQAQGSVLEKPQATSRGNILEKPLASKGSILEQPQAGKGSVLETDPLSSSYCNSSDILPLDISTANLHNIDTCMNQFTGFYITKKTAHITTHSKNFIPARDSYDLQLQGNATVEKFTMYGMSYIPTRDSYDSENQGVEVGTTFVPSRDAYDTAITHHESHLLAMTAVH